MTALLGGNVRIEPLAVPRDCRDGFGEAFWARPEAYLAPRICGGTPAFELLDEAQIRPGPRQLRADLRSGARDARHGNPPQFRPGHPLGCHRRKVPGRVVFEHVGAALVDGSGYERIATPGCSDRTIRRRLGEWAELGWAAPRFPDR